MLLRGMQFDRGYLSPYFVTNTEKMTTELENPLVLLVEKLINLQTNGSAFRVSCSS